MLDINVDAKTVVVSVVVVALAVLGYSVYNEYTSTKGELNELKESVRVAADTASMAKATADKQAEDATVFYRRTTDDIANTSSRLGSIAQRMRNQATTNSGSANTTQASSDITTEAERDIAECAAEYAKLGEQAAQASATAWALNDAWPVKSEVKSTLFKELQK